MLTLEREHKFGREINFLPLGVLFLFVIRVLKAFYHLLGFKA